MRSDRSPTAEQATAIATDARAVMVEAGAGTGKTGVMVDRYCRLACEQGVELDAILTITFTDKAAAELRQRIRAELSRRARGGSARAEGLLGALGSAWVTTIHGFCHRLLASHPVAAGVDPRFRVLDAPEADRAAHEAFDEALELFLSEGEQAARVETVAAFRIDSLRGLITSAHEELRSRGAPRALLPLAPIADPSAALGRALTVATQTAADLGESSRHRPLAEEAIAVLGERGAAISLEQVDALRPTGKAKEMKAYREAIEMAIASVAEAGEGGAAYEHCGRLLELFAERFALAKERRGGIDFEDLQLLSAELLERAEIGGAYRSRFRHLMVDEFQDTNRLQVRLIESLRGPGTRLMVVGDALQSIYGFRHADLEAFSEQREAIAADPAGELIELTGNFRSNPAVIGALNALGSELIGTEYQPLRVGVAHPTPESAEEGPAVELLLTARKGWDQLELEPAIDSGTQPHHVAESRFLAERLRRLAEDGTSRGEMVVLLRAFTHLDAYEDSLARAGLRPYVVGGRGYWSQQQVSDVCALLATIANPLDDQSLFGALASPACGVTPDTLWLLREASGRGRHVWPAVALTAGIGSAEIESPRQIDQIPETEIALLERFAIRLSALRAASSRLPLAELIDRAITVTGYDLAILLKPAGEARFANLRKLMRIAEEFESREGRDLRGLLDYLAFREESADESSAATAAEDHDGVRIMSVHRAKGLEFGVVAVPHLDRGLLGGGWAPLLTLGRGDDRRVGMQLRRLGARSINIYAHEALREEENERDAAEGLRLFHVAATRARRRLILSGVIREKSVELRPSTPIIERIVDAFGVDREHDSTITIPPPEPRPGLDIAFAPSQISVRLSTPTPERAAELIERHPPPPPARSALSGPAPLLGGRPRSVSRRPLSYSAISAYEECGYRFQLERVFGFGREIALAGPEGEVSAPSAREERSARGRVVHSLLEWSQSNGWRQPPAELLESHASAEGLPVDSRSDLASSVSGWLESDLLNARIRPDGAEIRSEVPLLLEIEGSVLRGSIDLLVERPGEAPLVVDYKTDRLSGDDPATRASGYRTQRSIYALAVAEARFAAEVEVAYLFLERPDDPQIQRLGSAELVLARAELEEVVGRIGAGEFAVAPQERRSEGMCRGCPARGRVCAGPRS